MSAPIRVLIADDEPLIVDAVTDLLAGDASIELLGAASDADTLIELARRHAPDVVLVDVRMPSGGGPRATREIREHRPRTRVVALSAYEDLGTVMEMLRAGACGYLVKGAEPQSILLAVHEAANGNGTLSGEVAGHVIGELRHKLGREERSERLRRERLDRTRNAIDADGISCVVQPIEDLETGATVGVEALARFADSSERGPDVWFADAEMVGLRSELELATLRRAVAHFPHLEASAFLSVNLSPRTMLVSGFGEALAGLPVDRLVIEITEHAPVRDYDALNEALSTFRAAGARLAVDDAGAGFASLRHILDLCPDIIKLDVSLVRGIPSEGRRRALATALISFARAIGAEVVAEGIETKEELEVLVELGVTLGQGYYLGRPAPCPRCDHEDPRSAPQARLRGTVPGPRRAQ